MAHGHGNIMIARGDGVPLFFPWYIRIHRRIPPPEYPLPTGYQSTEGNSTKIAFSTTTKQHPGFGFVLGRFPDPLLDQLLDRGPVLPCQPMCELPEEDSIQFPVPDRCVVRELVEIRPTHQLSVEVFYQVDLVLAVMARQLLHQPLGKAPEFVFWDRRHRTHRAPRASFANDAVSQKNKPVIDMSNMGFLHIQRQLQVVFQEGPAFFPHGFSLCLVSCD